MTRPVALVTGASAGIGRAFAERYAASHDLIVVARREERLRELAGALASRYGTAVQVVAADLGSVAGRMATRDAVDAAGGVAVAVVNAGFGAVGPVATADRERQVAMVDLNCGATVDLVCHCVGPMVTAGRGDVIIVSSAAAWQPIPYTATYAATKVFGLFLAEALHAELRGTGVRVIAACPGPVATEFGAVAGVASGAGWMPHESAEGVVTATLRALERGRSRVATGWLARLTTIAARVLPRRPVVAIAGAIHRRLDEAAEVR
jgi:short-subunit dehydrogenase